MSPLWLETPRPRVAVLIGNRAQELILKLEADVLARQKPIATPRIGTLSSAPSANTGAVVSTKRMGAEAPGTLWQTGLQSSALYPGFKLIAKDRGYDAFLVVASERFTLEDVQHFVPQGSVVEKLEIEGLRAFLDVLTCTPYVVTDSVFVGSFSLGFNNRVSFGWLSDQRQSDVAEFVFGLGREYDVDVVDLFGAVDESPPLPVPSLPTDITRSLVALRPQSELRPETVHEPNVPTSWLNLLRELPGNTDGYQRLREERMDRFDLLDRDPSLRLVDYVIRAGKPAFTKMQEALNRGKSLKLESISELEKGKLVSLSIQWDDPLEPPKEVRLKSSDRTIAIPILGAKVFQTLFDFDIYMKTDEYLEECETVTAGGAANVLRIPSVINQGEI